MIDQNKPKNQVMLWIVHCPYCHRVQIWDWLPDAIWCDSDDCRYDPNKPQMGVKKLIFEKGYNKANVNQVFIETED